MGVAARRTSRSRRRALCCGWSSLPPAGEPRRGAAPADRRPAADPQRRATCSTCWCAAAWSRPPTGRRVRGTRGGRPGLATAAVVAGRGRGGPGSCCGTSPSPPRTGTPGADPTVSSTAGPGSTRPSSGVGAAHRHSPPWRARSSTLRAAGGRRPGGWSDAAARYRVRSTDGSRLLWGDRSRPGAGPRRRTGRCPARPRTRRGPPATRWSTSWPPRASPCGRPSGTWLPARGRGLPACGRTRRTRSALFGVFTAHPGFLGYLPIGRRAAAARAPLGLPVSLPPCRAPTPASGRSSRRRGLRLIDLEIPAASSGRHSRAPAHRTDRRPAGASAGTAATRSHRDSWEGAGDAAAAEATLAGLRHADGRQRVAQRHRDYRWTPAAWP